MHEKRKKNWGSSILLIIVGLILVFLGGDILSGFVAMLAGLIIFPPVETVMKNKLNIELGYWSKIIIVLILLIIAGYLNYYGL